MSAFSYYLTKYHHLTWGNLQRSHQTNVYSYFEFVLKMAQEVILKPAMARMWINVLSDTCTGKSMKNVHCICTLLWIFWQINWKQWTVNLFELKFSQSNSTGKELLSNLNPCLHLLHPSGSLTVPGSDNMRAKQRKIADPEAICSIQSMQPEINFQASGQFFSMTVYCVIDLVYFY